MNGEPDKNWWVIKFSMEGHTFRYKIVLMKQRLFLVQKTILGRPQGIPDILIILPFCRTACSQRSVKDNNSCN